MIGVMLIMEGFGQHVDKGYIYAAMAFAGFVEVLQTLRRKAGK
jgi:predicted tellurium resistance membrane protein TerC